MRRIYYQCFLIFLAFTLLFITGCSFEAGKVSKRGFVRERAWPNVILITISSLRADHIGCFGYERETSPFFDEFAKENILFTECFSTSSWMMPATGSIFTSLYPYEHRASHINNSLSAECETLAEILREEGYYTAGFCCNPRLSSGSGFAQGFSYYDDYSVKLLLDSVTFGEGGKVDINKSRSNGLINGAVIRWLGNNRHKPFFLFVHYYDNHWDYSPGSGYDKLFDADYSGGIDGSGISDEPLYSNRPSPEDVKHIIALYDGEVRRTDADLGDLLGFLEKQGLMEESIVIVAGDHGEEFYEHGHTSHHGVYDEHIHIPAAISLPGEGYKGEVIDSLVSGLDIMPTVLDLVGVEIPSVCHGKSLVPVIEGEKGELRDSLFIEYTGGAEPDAFAVRSKRYKVVQTEGRVFGFDLLKDPGEQNEIGRENFTEGMKAGLEKLERETAMIRGSG